MGVDTCLPKSLVILSALKKGPRDPQIETNFVYISCTEIPKYKAL